MEEKPPYAGIEIPWVTLVGPKKKGSIPLSSDKHPLSAPSNVMQGIRELKWQNQLRNKVVEEKAPSHPLQSAVDDKSATVSPWQTTNVTLPQNPQRPLETHPVNRLGDNSAAYISPWQTQLTENLKREAKRSHPMQSAVSRVDTLTSKWATKVSKAGTDVSPPQHPYLAENRAANATYQEWNTRTFNHANDSNRVFQHPAKSAQAADNSFYQPWRTKTLNRVEENPRPTNNNHPHLDIGTTDASYQAWNTKTLNLGVNPQPVTTHPHKFNDPKQVEAVIHPWNTKTHNRSNSDEPRIYNHPHIFTDPAQNEAVYQPWNTKTTVRGETSPSTFPPKHPHVNSTQASQPIYQPWTTKTTLNSATPTAKGHPAYRQENEQASVHPWITTIHQKS